MNNKTKNNQLNLELKVSNSILKRNNLHLFYLHKTKFK